MCVRNKRYMTGLGKYSTGEYGQIGVYRVPKTISCVSQFATGLR